MKNTHDQSFIESHIILEFLSRDDHGFLNEQIIGKKEFSLLLEKYGSFNGCLEIADKLSYKYSRLIDYLKKNPNTQENSTKLVLPSGFVNEVKLVVDMNTPNNSLGYNPQKSIMDENGNFESIEIIVGGKPIPKEKISRSLFSHELQHAYEDWKLRTKGSHILAKKDNDYYGRNINQIPYTPILKKLQNVLYRFNKSELNAYINSIANAEPNKDRYTSVEEIIEEIKENKYYRAYEKCFEYVDEIASVKDSETQQDIMDYIDDVIKSKKFKTFNVFSKWLSNRSRNIKRKLAKIIPKIVYEKYRDFIPRTMWTSSNFPID